MTAEVTCGGEFAEFVSHHIFGHVDGNEFVTIVYSEGVANEFGGDH